MRAGPFSEHSRIIASKDQVSCDLAGEAAILSLKTQNYYGLDPVGARVWQLVQKPTTFAELRDTVIAEYEVDRAEIEADLHELLDQLEKEGLIEIAA